MGYGILCLSKSIMFSPSQLDVRKFFLGSYNKAKANIILTDIENIAYSVILEHPEYDFIFHDQDKYLNYQWYPEVGEINPFLHLSMHLSIIEQISINQPLGIKDLFDEMCHKTKDRHKSYHELIECLGEMLWQSQKYGTEPDPNLYLMCIKQKLSNSHIS